MATPWFHLPHVPAPGSVARLPAAEARHALGARRLGAGDAVVLFDGQGCVAQATLQGGGGREDDVPALVHSVEQAARQSPRVEVAVAPPKGDRWSTMADMLAQLAVARVHPMATAFGVRDAERVNRVRTERIFMEACKQCRCPWLPALGEPVTPAAFAAQVVAAGGMAVLCHPGGVPVQEVARQWAGREEQGASASEGAPSSAAPVGILIGPEGGFSDPEVAAMEQAGARRVHLGPTLLRVELAAVASVCAFRQAAHHVRERG